MGTVGRFEWICLPYTPKNTQCNLPCQQQIADCPKLGSVFPFHLKSSLRFWNLQILKLHFHLKHFHNLTILWNFCHLEKSAIYILRKIIIFSNLVKVKKHRNVFAWSEQQTSQALFLSLCFLRQLSIFLIIPLWAKQVGM